MPRVCASYCSLAALDKQAPRCIAGLLGFVFIKAWVAVGNKMGLKMQPFTAQENTVIQTTCVSCYGLAWYGGFATYLFSMTPKIQQVLGDNPGNATNCHLVLSWLYALHSTCKCVFTTIHSKLVKQCQPCPQGLCTIQQCRCCTKHGNVFCLHMADLAAAHSCVFCQAACSAGGAWHSCYAIRCLTYPTCE